MRETLVSWIGRTDLNAAAETLEEGCGPVCNAAQQIGFDRIVLLSNYPQSDADGFKEWLVGYTDAVIEVNAVSLSSPMDVSVHPGHWVS